MHVPDIYVAFCDRLEVVGDIDKYGHDLANGYIPYLQQSDKSKGAVELKLPFIEL
jgi:hypothetical protein